MREVAPAFGQVGGEPGTALFVWFRRTFLLSLNSFSQSSHDVLSGDHALQMPSTNTAPGKLRAFTLTISTETRVNGDVGSTCTTASVITSGGTI